MPSICIKAWVKGRVQGVFFRASTQKIAMKNGLSGYAKNLPDGRVEVLLQGPPDGVKKVQQWLYSGPPTAEVVDVTVESLEPKEIAGFEVY